VPGLHLLGVRHHGPGSARSVLRALDELRPDVVLVEAPADADDALGWIADPALVPPVALLGYVVNRPERAAFIPLAEFSPEWQAVRWALHHGVAVEAIDLPLAQTLADADDEREEPHRGADDVPVDPLGALAAAAGEPDAERWWEDLVEHRGDGEPVFDAVAEAMAAVRADTTTPPFDARREAHMRRRIRRWLRDDRTVVVVCGAWHVPALDPTVATNAADGALLRGRPKVKVAVTWVPWTHRRLRRATGYGAGVASPGWYDHVFRHPGPDGVSRFFVHAAHALRREGIGASPDHLIAASRLADTLAALRRRPRAGLAEVLDAAEAVLGGLPLVVDELVVGNAIGEVPPNAPQVPLARDLAAAQRAVRLKPTADVRVVELDLRTPTGLARSHLLHRLQALGIPWGTLEEGRGSSGTFRETWRLAWEPELSVRVVELAGHGTTVVAAAASRLIERVTAATRLAEAAAAVDVALLADLPDALRPAVRVLGELAARSPDVAELMDALRPLASALRYGDVRNTEPAGLRVVFDELVVRVLAGLGRAVEALDDDAARSMIERLSATQAALAIVDHPARRDAFPEVLERIAEHRRVHGLVQGRATRLLHDAGRWSPEQVEARLGRALTPGTPAASGAAFVEGFLAGSGTVLLHDAHLLAAVDAWIASLSAEAFEDVVPLLRRTFGAFEPAERRQLGALLATGRIERAAPMGDDVDEPRARAALATVRTLLGLPPATSDAQEVRPADPVRVRRAGSTSDATSVSHADQRRVRNDRADGGGR
jgi:hypothetical protein